MHGLAIYLLFVILQGLINSFENVSDSRSIHWDIEEKKMFLQNLPLLMEGISSFALLITFEEKKPLTVDQNSMGKKPTTWIIVQFEEGKKERPLFLLYVL